MLEAATLPLYIKNRLEVRAIYTLFYQEKERGFLFKGESHDLIELVYVDKGELHNVVNGADTLLSQGEMMLYAPGFWHMQYADLDVEPSFITVSFDLSGDGELTSRSLCRWDGEAFRFRKGGDEIEVRVVRWLALPEVEKENENDD